MPLCFLAPKEPDVLEAEAGPDEPWTPTQCPVNPIPGQIAGSFNVGFAFIPPLRLIYLGQEPRNNDTKHADNVGFSIHLESTKI